MRLSEITKYLEEIAPLRFQEDYDNSGLIYGDPDMSISGAIIALDATVDVINEAIEKKYNLVITHHPIIFKGIKKFDPSYYVDRAVIQAIKNDIAIYAIHTNLDNVLANGVNFKIGQKLGLTHLEVLRPSKKNHLETDYQIGAGAIGKLKEPMSESRFFDYLKGKMNLSTIKHTKILNKKVESVALCGGAGSFLISEAQVRDADVFVTSDLKYHEFFDANETMILVDIGHYESEFYTIELLSELISQKFPKFAAHYTKVITNPVFYY